MGLAITICYLLFRKESGSGGSRPAVAKPPLPFYFVILFHIDVPNQLDSMIAIASIVGF
jgi:hypothetical protein